MCFFTLSSQSCHVIDASHESRLMRSAFFSPGLPAVNREPRRMLVPQRPLSEASVLTSSALVARRQNSMTSQYAFRLEAQTNSCALRRDVQAVGKPLATAQTETGTGCGVQDPVDERTRRMGENVGPLSLSTDIAQSLHIGARAYLKLRKNDDEARLALHIDVRCIDMAHDTRKDVIFRVRRRAVWRHRAGEDRVYQCSLFRLSSFDSEVKCAGQPTGSLLLCSRNCSTSSRLFTLIPGR